MRKYTAIFAVISSVAFISSYCFAATAIEDHHKGHRPEAVNDENPELSGRVENGIRVIGVKASRYKFEPDPIVVNLGEKVRLVVTATDVAHGIAIQKFNVKLSVPKGKTEYVEFIANKPGVFPAYCSVYCGTGHPNMHASFVVRAIPDTSALKADIYSKIGCITCKDMTIDKCNCPKSREMKAYIDALIEMEVGRDEIFYKVARKYSLKAIMDKPIRQAIEQRLIKESGGKAPQAVLEIGSANLGTVSKSQGKISKGFKLQNQGNTILTVNSLKTSCPCVTAAIKVGKDKSPYFGTNGSPADWQVQINPGKSAEIEVVIDLQHRSVSTGKLIREVYIATNDLLDSEITLRVEAEVTD